ncbi:FtsX-like permease family protein [Dactylosporangium vinaceum]|uniref:ABC transporter permease n=1 Tax=Dactylosporangium vinaceum TaxID=53362 RepID=A0ABV5MSW1_9ACTN|nr:FtsX-like permease family protein [Dactylosporangium vinaceum]UAB97667.1 FtsX-like permease family protein [Dactylosporangium vinaceum]
MIGKLIRRGLAAHKLRLGLTMLGIILGVAFVAGTLMFAATVQQTINGVFAASGAGTDVVVRPQKAFGDQLSNNVGLGQPVAGSVLDTVQGVDGVDKVHGTVQGFAAILDRDGKAIGSSQVGNDWTDDGDFTQMRLSEGHAPAAAGEVAIDAASAKKVNAKVGDQIKVATKDGVQTYTLTGIFRFGQSGTVGGTTITAFDPATAGKVLTDRPGTYGEIHVHAKAGVTQTRLRDAIATRLPAGLEAITGQQAIDDDAASVKDVITLLQTFLLAFALIAVLVSSFIIFNTFSMLVTQRIREMALLRAVGANRGQVIRLILGEATVFGVLGSVLGVGGGVLLAIGLRDLLGAIGPQLPANGLVIPATALWVPLVIGVTVTLLAAYVPARRASRIPPVAALREEAGGTERPLRVRIIIGSVLLAAGLALVIAGELRLGGAPLAKLAGGVVLGFAGVVVLSPAITRPLAGVLGWPLATVFGTVGRLSRENARRNPRRTAATASALMIGLTLVGAVTVLGASAAASVDRQLDSAVHTDFQITGPNATSFSGSVRDAVAGVPGVHTAVGVRNGQIKLGGTVRPVVAADPAAVVALYGLTVGQGSSGLRDDEFLADATTARDAGWTLGSPVTAQFQDGTTVTLRVGGIYTDVKTVVDAVPHLVVSRSAYAPHDAGDVIDQVAIITDLGADPAATRAAIEAKLAQWPTLQLFDKQAVKDSFRSTIDLVLSLVLVLLVLSVVIAAIGIVNTLALAVIERTREIGLLRAVGMQRRQVRRMIRYEAVVIAVYGSILGLLIGVGAGCAVQSALRSTGIDHLEIPVGRLLAYVLVGAVIGVLAAFWPARRAARLNVLRAIATQ